VEVLASRRRVAVFDCRLAGGTPALPVKDGVKSLVKSDAAGQKATAGFLGFNFPKHAKHWQPRSLTNIDHAFRHWQEVC
jgi:hypothetical protein